MSGGLAKAVQKMLLFLKNIQNMSFILKKYQEYALANILNLSELCCSG